MNSLLSKLLGLHFAANNQNDKIPYDNRLDGLRGFAACSVMYVHIMGDGELGPFALSAEWARNIHLSRSAVMIFFITSGYVIGLTNRKQFSPSLINDYIYRRCLRIVPVYLIALGAGWLAFQGSSWQNLGENIIFLQNCAWGIQPLMGDLPVWSLHYEMVYYFGFILIWRWQPRVWPLAILFLILPVADWFEGGIFSVLGGWSSGAFFWLTGLLLAWNRPAKSSTPLIAFLLLAIATERLCPGKMLLNGIGLPYAGCTAIQLPDLFLLPVCVVVFSGVLEIDFPGLKALRWVSVMIPLGTCILLWKMGRLLENAPWTIASAALVLALPLLFLESATWGQRLLKKFRPLGKISYGLYLFHLPISFFVVQWYPWQTGLANYLGAVISWLALTLGLSWVCEFRLQPRLVAFYKQWRISTH